ncbi:DUF2153 domain-containing protein [Candidatus Bathyarchaeota archaeon]|nr:MAG: DUF2153 domain-containing protein [Candidatus Bathyarchaeota archaeon]
MSVCGLDVAVGWVEAVGERWIRECEEFLRQIRENRMAENPDRLDLVRAMHVALLALNHSVIGWLQYVNNPDIMGKFTLEELREMSQYLNKFAEDFIEYDIKVTKAGMEKGLRELEEERGEEDQPFYI